MGRLTKQRTLKTNSISKTPPARKSRGGYSPGERCRSPAADDNEPPRPAYQPEVAEQGAKVETDEKYVVTVGLGYPLQTLVSQA